MVAVFEVVFLIVFVVLGLWWFRRTNLYRARDSRFGPSQGVPKSDRDPAGPTFHPGGGGGSGHHS